MLISAKFNGRCSSCGDPILMGEQISWERGRAAVYHAGCSSEGRARAQAAAASRAVDADIELACPPGRSYMPFQKAGIAFALSRVNGGVIFGDEMGLGKTIQCIGWVNNEPKIKTVLVICPKSLTLNWVKEWRAWDTRGFRVSRCLGTGSQVIVLSIEEAKSVKAELLAMRFSLVVFDEAQFFKNEKSQRGKLAQELALNADFRAVLSGTPIPNKVIELWPLVKIADPKEWNPGGENKGFFRFAIRYAAANKDSGYWDFSGASNLEELQQRLRSTTMVRRLKKDVLTELPAKQRQIIELPANGSAAAVKAESAAWDKLESRLEDLRIAVELSKASDDPNGFARAVASLNKASAVAFTEISAQRHEVAVAKIPATIEYATSILEGDDTSKLVIWVHHHDVGDAIRKGLAEFGVTGIDGRNSTEERDAAVTRFQTDPSCRVFVGGIAAAGTGLTLTASSRELFVELSWVPSEMQQAEDRCHRIGQKESVLVQLLVLEGSLDARMAEVLVAKMTVADAALDAKTEREPALPVQLPATSGTVRELAAVAQTLSAADVREIHGALRRLAGQCDGAASWDGAGFSKIDVRIGHSLANMPGLSLKQAALGLKLCRKYRRQLGDGCWSKEKTDS